MEQQNDSGAKGRVSQTPALALQVMSSHDVKGKNVPLIMRPTVDGGCGSVDCISSAMLCPPYANSIYPNMPHLSTMCWQNNPFQHHASFVFGFLLSMRAYNACKSLCLDEEDIRRQFLYM